MIHKWFNYWLDYNTTRINAFKLAVLKIFIYIEAFKGIITHLNSSIQNESDKNSLKKGRERKIYIWKR